MKTHPKIFLIVIFMVSITNQPSWAYDSKHVHVSVNHHASLSAESFKLDCFAKEFLGFPRGIERTSVYGKPILKWLEEGGTDEDENPRWLHHFHDPMVPWHKAGLKYSILGSSSAIWAQRDGIDGTSWGELRNLYYLALVEGKEGFWSRMFHGLGHLMHLVADLACPAHTRDDMHPEGDIYEKWAELNSETLDYQAFPVDRQIFTQAVPNDLVPITALWDQDVYDGSNPSEGLVGLAEYTNAYFASQDTLYLSPSYEYPHPNTLDTDFWVLDWKNPEAVDREDGKIDKKIYLKHTAAATPYRVAAAAYFAVDCLPPETCWGYTWVLDDEVHKDYAARLIPRAVGYAAALLDYFFRGTIDILPGTNGLYSFYDPWNANGDPGGFQTVKLRARNSTTNPVEAMSEGVIKLVVKHKVALSNPFVSEKVPISEEFTYLVATERNGVGSLPAEGYAELIFDLPQPIPVEATDVYLQVVFRGKLGAEEDAIAVGFKDISEPTPFDVFNNMDKICLNGAWFTAGSADAIALADTNQNGMVDANEWDIFPHVLTSVSFRFFPYTTTTPLYPPPSEFRTTNLPPGMSHRVFLLSDHYYRYGNSNAYLAPTPAFAAVDLATHGYFLKKSGSFDSVKRQTDFAEGEICGSFGFTSPCEISWNPRFFRFRGKDLWSGMIYLSLTYPADASCSLATLDD